MISFILEEHWDLESPWARSHLLEEEVVHAAVVVGGGQDVQRVVLPLGGLQADATDFQAASPLHLRGRLLVLLAVLGGPGRNGLQVRAARRRRALCWSREEETDGGVGGQPPQERILRKEFFFVFVPRISPASLMLACFSLDSFFSPCLVLLQNLIFPLTLLITRQRSVEMEMMLEQIQANNHP